MEYFVCRNLNHDGVEYRRGDQVELAEDAARPLLEAGVVQTDPVSDPALPENRERVVPPKEQDGPRVGGEQRAESGEPSVDGRDDQAASRTAEDITPQPSERMTREELEQMAQSEGLTDDQIAAASNKAALVSLIVEKRNEGVPEGQPPTDPSANL